VHGRLTLDGDLALADVFEFFQLPLPENASTTLGDWLTTELARDQAEGDSIEWHGAKFIVKGLQDKRIARVGITLARRVK